ncbi:hypothetical protein M378DRAFT_182579, partial [Amanita muscaria Koide BX008]
VSAIPTAPAVSDELLGDKKASQRKRIQLDGGVSYLVSDPSFDRLGLRVHSALHVILCIDCRAAYIPQDLPGHLYNKHGVSRFSSEQKKAFETLVASHNIVEKAANGPLPANHGPPVELVPIENGFMCGVTGCSYAALAQGSISRHRRDVHGPGRTEKEVKVMVQTLYTGVGKEFYIVNPSLTSSILEPLFNTLISSVLPSMTPLVEEVPVEGREIPPFHRVTQWWDILGDVVKKQESRRQVITLAAVPTRAEEGLGKLPALCRTYLIQAQEASQKAGHTIRKKLVPEADQDNQRSSYWRDLTTEHSLDNYSRDVARSLATYIRGALVLRNQPVFKLPITAAGQADAQDLYNTLLHGEATWKSLHNLMKRLWELPELNGPDTGRSTYLATFLAAAALHDDGSLMEPDSLSSLLSHLKYGARSFCMVEAMETQTCYESILEAVSSVVDHYLEGDSLKPFSQICDLSSYTASLLARQPKDPRVGWTQAMDIVSIDGEKVPLTLLREGIQNQLASLSKTILDITGEAAIPDWMSGDRHIVDRPREHAPGYTFLDDPSFLNAHHSLLRRLVEDPEWRIGVLDNSGHWMWNMSAALRFLTHSSKVVQTLMPVLQIICGKRGTELADAKIRNTCSRSRNLYVQLGRLLFTGCYTKTSNLAGRDSYLPTQLPLEISQPLIHYLAVIRPVECILSRVVWGDQVGAMYRSYLFASQGRLLGSKENSQYLGAFFRRSCNADIQLNRCRQLEATLGREFVDERFLIAHRRSDKGMGHSSGIGKNHYAVDHDMLEFTTSDELFEQCWVDTQYQAVLGLGNEPPPVALRLRGTPTEERLSETISGSVQTAFQALAGELKQSLVQALVQEMRGLIRTEVQEALTMGLSPPSVPLRTRARYQDKQDHVPSTSLIPDSDPIQLLQEDDREAQTDPPVTAQVQHQTHSPYQTPQRTVQSSPVPDYEPPVPAQLSDHDACQPSLQVSSSATAARISPPSHRPSSSLGFSSMIRRHPNPVANSFYSTLLRQSNGSAMSTAANVSDSESEALITESSFVSAMPSSPVRNDSESEALIAESSFASAMPSSPVGNKRKDQETVLATFKSLYGKDARPKSPRQLELCEAVVSKSFNVIAVLPTGAGKSTAWLVPAVVLPAAITIVVVPFRELLTQHLEKAVKLGLKSMRWTADCQTNIPEDVSLLFMAVESINSQSFHKLMRSQLANRIRTVVFDEAHVYLGAHEARNRQHQKMLEYISKQVVQRIFLSATIPVRMMDIFLKKVHLASNMPSGPSHITIRQNTSRPELAHHVLTVSPSVPASRSTLDITAELAKALQNSLDAQERMIIFVMQVCDAGSLSQALGCPQYHSELCEDDDDEGKGKGNGKAKDLKAHNQSLWIQGKSNVIVATPALIQGIDYSGDPTALLATFKELEEGEGQDLDATFSQSVTPEITSISKSVQKMWRLQQSGKPSQAPLG